MPTWSDTRAAGRFLCGAKCPDTWHSDAFVPTDPLARRRIHARSGDISPGLSLSNSAGLPLGPDRDESGIQASEKPGVPMVVFGRLDLGSSPRIGVSVRPR